MASVFGEGLDDLEDRVGPVVVVLAGLVAEPPPAGVELGHNHDVTALWIGPDRQRGLCALVALVSTLSRSVRSVPRPAALIGH